jgi:hypothetical protein
LALLASCDEDSTTTPGDTTPPARVEDLTAASLRSDDTTAFRGDGVRLTWTAPGDDGTDGQASAYRIRYADAPLTEATWDSATAVEDVPAPGSAGETEALTIPGLGLGTWYFALRAADDVPNWSPLSNVASSAILPDTLPPDPIDDLVAIAVSQTAIHLEWTAPVDDGDDLASASPGGPRGGRSRQLVRALQRRGGHSGAAGAPYHEHLGDYGRLFAELVKRRAVGRVCV